MGDSAAAPVSSSERFLSITKNIHVLRPLEGGAQSDTSSPTVILIFGWMGAKTLHLHKYTAAYVKRYPNAAQILVECPLTTFMKRRTPLKVSLTPVVDLLEAFGCIPPRSEKTNDNANHSSITPRVLVHVFSNGGCYLFALLCQMLSQVPRPQNSPRILSAIIYDSCPSRGDLRASYRAFTMGISSPWRRFLMAIFIVFIRCYDILASLLLRRKLFADFLHATLLDPRLLPWTDERTPRLYVFSKMDDMVSWVHVKDHADSARASGLNTRIELFGNSQHVAHARADPSRYWGHVDEVWKDCLTVGKIAE